MALLYLATAAMGIVFLFAEPDRDMSAEEAKLMGAVILIVVWVFGLVLICLGLSSACCLPACIPLLIFWLKPEMKAFYGRDLNPLSPPPPPPQWT
jgi:hypothetical protein